MDSLLSLKKTAIVLILLGCANSLPIFARKLLGTRWEWPVDGGACWIDGRRLFGSHKTWRGIAASLTGTALAGSLTPYGAETGFLLALLSMTGDLTASFFKRRLNLKSGARAPGLDQGVESLLPLLVLKPRLGMTWLDVAVTVLLFALFELLLSPVLYKLGIRRNPY